MFTAHSRSYSYCASSVLHRFIHTHNVFHFRLHALTSIRNLPELSCINSDTLLSIYYLFTRSVLKIIRWRSISMRAGPAFSQFDWSKAGLNMGLPVFVYSHTKTSFKISFKIGQLLCGYRSFTSNHAKRTLQGSCFV